jgi:DNA polymerase III gamma/tau subunit
MLQNLKYMILHKQNIMPQDIIQINGGIDEKQFKNFWEICTTGTSLDILKLSKFINREGFPIMNILIYLNKKLLQSNMTDKQKSNIAIEVCQSEKRLIEGSDEHLQILNILMFINIQAKQSK